MHMDGDGTCALRERLVLAAMGIAAAGCSPAGEASAPGPGEASATATVASTSEVTIAPVASAAPIETSEPPVPPPTLTASAKPAPPRKQAKCQSGGASKEQCFTPFGSMRSVGTGGPAEAPPRADFDPNGCLPSSLVSNGCCNPAALGPRLAGGQCCYEFCEGPCCGRAFVVDGAPRVAATRATPAWLASGAVDAVAARDTTRRAACDAWLRDAQLEHASVASFGRFVLELLSVAAPAALLREAGEAMLDEVRHAELCFAVVAHLGGGAVGPAELPMEGALAQRSLAELAAAVVVEGCVGETIAALMAARQLEGATDPFVREVLSRIARDEARHAELGFRFLRWALDSGDATTRASVTRAFEQALHDERGFPEPASAEALDGALYHALGRLTSSEQNEVAFAAREAVLRPAVEILLAPRAQRRLPN